MADIAAKLEPRDTNIKIEVLWHLMLNPESHGHSSFDISQPWTIKLEVASRDHSKRQLGIEYYNFPISPIISAFFCVLIYLNFVLLILYTSTSLVTNSTFQRSMSKTIGQKKIKLLAEGKMV